MLIPYVPSPPVTIMSNDGGRVARLSKLFDNVLRGRQTLTYPSQHSQFLEAFCLQPDPPVCIDKIIASNVGLSSLQNAFWSNISLPFLNGSATDALLYLQAPRIKTISSGQFLTKILQAIVEPAIFWDAFVGAFKAKQLSEKGQKCFAWLFITAYSHPKRGGLALRTPCRRAAASFHCLPSSRRTQHRPQHQEYHFCCIRLCRCHHQR